MNLTGKCKEEFEDWLGSQTINTGSDIHKWYVTWVKFHIISDSAKYGVYVDYFDSVGIHIKLTPYFDSVTKIVLWFFTLKDKRCVHLNSHLENKANTRPEARTKAIEKADKLRNDLLLIPKK
jgi:hypothetical protein